MGLAVVADERRNLADAAPTADEGRRGIEQVAKAITQMEQVTHQTAANAEESAATAEELNARSEALQEIVERLALRVEGTEAQRGHARSVRR